MLIPSLPIPWVCIGKIPCDDWYYSIAHFQTFRWLICPYLRTAMCIDSEGKLHDTYLAKYNTTMTNLLAHFKLSGEQMHATLGSFIFSLYTIILLNATCML